MSASITLSTVWINLASDPTKYESFTLMSSLNVATGQTGEVRQYANGRRRIVRRAGIARDINLNLPSCTRAQITWLETYVAQIVCVRDDRGRKIWATYFLVPVDEDGGDITNGDVSLVLKETTATDVV